MLKLWGSVHEMEKIPPQRNLNRALVPHSKACMAWPAIVSQHLYTHLQEMSSLLISCC